MDKITINLKELKSLRKKGAEIFITPEAENGLLKLLEMKDEIEEAISETKKNIEKEALKRNKNFSSIRGDKVKIQYRAFGQRFFIDESKLDQVPKEVYDKQVKTYFKIKTKEIEKFVKERGNLPIGVNEIDRKKSISISKID